ncbi:MAG: 50S ribosomal protein L6 [Elusimicrobiota bacterium]|jgi:large subunit ribosomal protein L6|nr:50S ribosomal protein L6 [Elusimicrobiota bacterium]
MSRLGKKPIQLPEKVKAEFKNSILEMTGPNGKLSQKIDERISVKINDGNISFEQLGTTREHNILQGLYRGLAKNMLEGVTNGFKKELEIVGLGYKAGIEGGKNLTMSVGFSHPVSIEIPPTVKVTAVLNQEKNTIVTIIGNDKYEVGAFAAKVRDVKHPEPYKGFGIRYLGEHILRKAGKAAAGGAAKK